MIRPHGEKLFPVLADSSMTSQGHVDVQAGTYDRREELIRSHR